MMVLGVPKESDCEIRERAESQINEVEDGIENKDEQEFKSRNVAEVASPKHGKTPSEDITRV